MFDFHKKCRKQLGGYQSYIQEMMTAVQSAVSIIMNRRSTCLRTTLEKSITLLVDEVEKKEQLLDEAAAYLWKIVGGEPVDENFREAVKAFCGKLVPKGFIS